MTYNGPPDNFILDIFSWLRNEIYPGLLNETFDDRAAAVWVCGSRGYISIWQTNGLDHDPEAKHQDAKQKLYTNINNTKNPPPPTEARRLFGLLRVDGLSFRDAAGPVLPMFCHFGEAFSAFVRRPDSVRQELDTIAQVGYQGIRFWDVLGYWDSAWKGKEVSPVAFINHSGTRVDATTGYYSRLAEFLRECQSRGLKVHHSRGDQNSWTWDQIAHHIRQVGVVQSAVGLDLIALNEASNESWQNGIPQASRLHQLCDLMPDGPIKATSAPDDGYGGETPEGLAPFKRDVAIIHGYRGGVSHNRIAHIQAMYQTLPNAGVPGWQGEPAGPGAGVTVGQESNVEALCLMAAMALSTRQAWTYMSSHGVFWNGPLMDMPGFREVARIPKLIDPTITSWILSHGGDRFRGTRVLVANGDGTLRCDSAFQPGTARFQTIVYGDPGMHHIPVERAFSGHVINPVTHERRSISLNPGQTFSVGFERGVIIQGEVR